MSATTPSKLLNAITPAWADRKNFICNPCSHTLHLAGNMLGISLHIPSHFAGLSSQWLKFERSNFSLTLGGTYKDSEPRQNGKLSGVWKCPVSDTGQDKPDGSLWGCLDQCCSGCASHALGLVWELFPGCTNLGQMCSVDHSFIFPMLICSLYICWTFPVESKKRSLYFVSFKRSFSY